MSTKKNFPDIVFTDLDGTLFDKDHRTVLGRTMDAIENLRKKGGLFVPTTGRAESFIPFDRIPESDYVITCNGALVSDSSGRIIYDVAIPVENRKALWKALKPVIDECAPVFEFFCGKDVFFEKKVFDEIDLYAESLPLFHSGMVKEGRGKCVEDFREIVEDPGIRLNKINLPRPTPEISRRMLDVLSGFDCFSVTSSGKAIEVMDLNCSKGNTVRWLASHVGVDMDMCVAFGDSYNDLEMLNAVGFGVAMGNSNQTVLEKVKCKTSSNTENGIAIFLESTFF